MADRLNVMFQGLKIINADDGSDFFEEKGITWSNLQYADAVKLQALFLGVLNETMKWGQDKAGKGHGKP